MIQVGWNNPPWIRGGLIQVGGLIRPESGLIHLECGLIKINPTSAGLILVWGGLIHPQRRVDPYLDGNRVGQGLK